MLLRRIGDDLDLGVFPSVGNGGLVVPGQAASFFILPGLESFHESRERKRGSARGTRQRSADRPANSATARDPSPGTGTSVVEPDLRAAYQIKIAEKVGLAYPGARSWHQGSAVWVVAESRLLPDIAERAIFVVGISYTYSLIRSWAFWRLASARSLIWIGPRHTNSPDGSICAFEPTDGTWVFGDPLVTLLDLYSVWALRHMYLKRFGRWPGQQSVPLAFERVKELRPDEFCGCGSDTLYANCCMANDLARDRVSDTFLFEKTFGIRKPPAEITEFASGRTANVPDIEDLLTR